MRNDAIAALSARGLMARLMPRAKQLTKAALSRATDLFVREDALARPEFGRALVRQLSRRGTRVLLVYSDNDPDLAELERYMGPEGQRARAMPGVTKRLIEGADHTFTPSEARRRLRETLHAFLMEGAPAQVSR